MTENLLNELEKASACRFLQAELKKSKTKVRE